MREDEIRPKVPDVGGHNQDELSMYGDEQDVPVRKRRSSKKKPVKKAGKAKKRPAEASSGAKKVKKRKKRRRTLFEWLFAGGGTSTRRERGALRLFGREIHLTFWPTFLIVMALLALAVLLLQSNSLVIDERDVTLVGLPSDLEGTGFCTFPTLPGGALETRRRRFCAKLERWTTTRCSSPATWSEKAATRNRFTSCSRDFPPANPSTLSPAIPTRSRFWTPRATSPVPPSRWCWRTGFWARSSAARPMWTGPLS